jgi:hypothetical protein
MIYIHAKEEHRRGGNIGRDGWNPRNESLPSPVPDFFPANFPVSTPPPKQENLLLNLVFNIVLPALVLSKLSTPERLGPVYSLVIALSFPLAYGVWDYVARRHANFISVIGFVSVLLTGGLALSKMDGMWFAVKEAAIPTVIGLAVLLSLKTKTPLVRTMLYNPQVIDVEKVDAALEERGNRTGFDRLLLTSSYLLTLSFLLSAVLNFALARYLLKSPSGTPAFNAELARMQVLSWPVIVVPTMVMTIFALLRLLKGLKRLTGLTMDQIFRSPPPKKA